MSTTSLRVQGRSCLWVLIAVLSVSVSVFVAPALAQDESPAAESYDTQIPHSPSRPIYLSGLAELLPTGVEEFRDRNGASWRVFWDDVLRAPRFVAPHEEFRLLDSGGLELDLSGEFDPVVVTGALRRFVDSSIRRFVDSSMTIRTSSVSRAPSSKATRCVVSDSALWSRSRRSSRMTRVERSRSAVPRFASCSVARERFATRRATSFVMRSHCRRRRASGEVLRPSGARKGELTGRIEEDGYDYENVERQFAFLEGDASSLTPVWAAETVDPIVCSRQGCKT